MDLDTQRATITARVTLRNLGPATAWIELSLLAVPEPTRSLFDIVCGQHRVR